jgi:hypothetical protein
VRGKGNLQGYGGRNFSQHGFWPRFKISHFLWSLEITYSLASASPLAGWIARNKDCELYTICGYLWRAGFKQPDKIMVYAVPVRREKVNDC